MESEPSHAENITSAISRGIVHLLKEYYGRGPVSTRAFYRDDHVLVLLSGGFSKAEETLLAAGMGEAVTDQRHVFQELMRDRFVGMVEEITGREVVSFMSANDQEADVMAELFLLSPHEPG
jgi:uncharacterized protein YbcI